MKKYTACKIIPDHVRTVSTVRLIIINLLKVDFTFKNGALHSIFVKDMM